MTLAEHLLTVLVVSGGKIQGLGLLQMLRESQRVRVVVADINADNLTGYLADGVRLVPRVSTGAAFVDAIRGLVKSEDVRLIFPSTEHELMALAEARAGLEREGARVAVSDAAWLATVRDRRSLRDWLRTVPVPVLPDRDPRDGASEPLLGKPRHGWGGRGHVVLRSADDASAALRDGLIESHVFEPLLEGFDELSADFSIGFDGSVSGIGLRRRVCTSGGFAVVSDDAECEAAHEAVAMLAAKAVTQGGRGMFNVQLLIREGQLVVSDLNPRVATSAAHWRGTGFNPALHVCASVEPAVGDWSRRPHTQRRVLRVLENQEVPSPAPSSLAVRGVVLDLDDTLIDQKAWILAKLTLLHDEWRARLPGRDEFLRGGLAVLEEGDPARLLDGLAARFSLAPDLLPSLIGSMRRAVPRPFEPWPDVLPTLESLRRRGLRLGLVSDNPADSQRQKLAATGLASWFDAIVFSREVGAEKPDRRPFDAVAAGLELPPEALVMAGDNPHRDAEGALAAGFAMAYIVRRTNALRGFDGERMAQLHPAGQRLRVVQGLRPLLWCIG